MMVYGADFSGLLWLSADPQYLRAAAFLLILDLSHV